MNRLILVGNGFDLAHGLKTSYNNFMLWYINRSFCKAFSDYEYEDDLITVKRVKHAPTNFNTVSSIKESIEDCYHEGQFKALVTNTWFLPPEDSYNMPNPINLTVHSDFFRELLENCSDNNWVDIEGSFYDRLKLVLNLQLKLEKKNKRLADLNKSLSAIINLLETYLGTLPPSNYIEGYMKIFTSPIFKGDVHNSTLMFDSEPESTYMLNFNYTATLSEYIRNYSFHSQKQTPEVNYIHGKLNDEGNKIVFGFGDELDEDYLKMEKEKAKGYFDHIKSFWYFRTSNYHNLIRFIDSDEYQVYVLGHSCGLSDRTMLNMVFEHPNCKSIKIYYHGTLERNNYVSLTHEIARHFKDKVEMRKKIVSLDQSYSMPQA